MTRKLIQFTLLVCALLVTSASYGQETFADSGMSGDGIPDVYYDPTSGVLTVDSDGIDLVAIFVGGADVSVSGCSLCDTGPNDMPGSATDLSDFSTWTVGRSANGSTQWIRGAPLSGLGFRGVVGEYWLDLNDTQHPWPDDVGAFVNFPDAGAGIANYGADAQFGAIWDNNGVVPADPNLANWNVLIGTDDGRSYYTNVTVVPEPGTFAIFCFAGFALAFFRRV